MNESIRIKTEESRVAKQAWPKYHARTVNLFTLLKNNYFELTRT